MLKKEWMKNGKEGGRKMIEKSGSRLVEMEWHSIDDVDAVGQDEELVELVEDIGTPVLEDVNPIWVNEEDE